MSALQMWGIESGCVSLDSKHKVVEVEDEDKEAFRAHVEALFGDMK